MTQQVGVEAGQPGAAAHPYDRLPFGYFPSPSGGDPNRIDGYNKADGATALAVLTVPVPAPCAGLLVVRLVALRTTPAAPPAVGGATEIQWSFRRDGPNAAPVLAAPVVVSSTLDGAYVIAAAASPDGQSIIVTFTGLVGEKYSVGASADVYGVRA